MEKNKHQQVVHELKILPRFFKDIKNNIKTFEIRKNDRDFKVGHVVFLKEYDLVGNFYTGQTVKVIIIYMLTSEDFVGIKDGYCVFGIKHI